jgi:hypothetical protein
MLQDPSAIGATTGITDTLTILWAVLGRGPMTCEGTTAFTGTINWTKMSLTAPQITFDCNITYTNVVLSLDKQQ